MQPIMAQRWVVKAHIDDNTCDECKANDGKTYKNRADAYADYPNGRGYKKCVGAQYGNTCRCKILKRGRKGGSSTNMGTDLAPLIARGQALTAKLSARDLAAVSFAAKGLTAATEPMRADGNAIYLYDAIGGWDGTAAIDVAQALAGMTGPVDLHFNSPGGFIFEGTAMFNVLKAYTGGPITSWIDGYAASAASFVMLAASPYDAATDTGGIRMAENAFVMVHDGMGLAMGTADDMREAANLLDMLSDTIAQMYANRAGGTAEAWRNTMTDGDTWYTAQAALADGLVDIIVGQAPEPAEEEPAQEQPATALFDLGLFQPTARIGAPVYASDTTTITSSTSGITATIDASHLEGLRNALKGAFA